MEILEINVRKDSMRTQITQQQFDEERALYALRQANVAGCTFAGPQDGESALKESRDVTVHNCKFSLRYPFWHAKDFSLSDSCLDSACRAPIWYAEAGTLRRCRIEGVKAIRECKDMLIEQSSILSPEFGWKCRGVTVRNCHIESEYLFLECKEMEIDGLDMKGKYSFQYTENGRIDHSELDTKDAFWHSKNLTVTNSTLKGEYLGWFSEGLTLIDCHISGTQPLCYCKDLRLIRCTMENTDLAFEYSDVNVEINGHILSVKNPRSGHITADSIGEIIREGSIMPTDCIIDIKKYKI